MDAATEDRLFERQHGFAPTGRRGVYEAVQQVLKGPLFAAVYHGLRSDPGAAQMFFPPEGEAQFLCMLAALCTYNSNPAALDERFIVNPALNDPAPDDLGAFCRTMLLRLVAVLQSEVREWEAIYTRKVPYRYIGAFDFRVNRSSRAYFADMSNRNEEMHMWCRDFLREHKYTPLVIEQLMRSKTAIPVLYALTFPSYTKTTLLETCWPLVIKAASADGIHI